VLIKKGINPDAPSANAGAGADFILAKLEITVSCDFS